MIKRYNKIFKEQNEDNFTVEIVDKHGKEFILNIFKQGGKWHEKFISGNRTFYTSKSYQSYLKKEDILIWLRKDFQQVTIVDESESTENEFSSIALEYKYKYRDQKIAFEMWLKDNNIKFELEVDSEAYSYNLLTKDTALATKAYDIAENIFSGMQYKRKDVYL